MGTQTQPKDSDFNVLQFEKTLTNLKDSQDSINSCCKWCLENRQYHKKIVTAWLNVIKRVQIEQRLVLFYLANDVVQYSKRKKYDYVDSWGTAIQKATTLVRDEKVKNKILRIFKIWEQRGVYGDEFITDLCGLISAQPAGTKNDEPHEFQANYVINKIKNCTKLELDTDKKLKVLKEHNPNMLITEGLINALKDRAHVDDVEKELDTYVTHIENYVNALKLEIKNRIGLITVLKQSETQLEADRKEVKYVNHAYKTFGQRVKAFQKKLQEHIETLPSPVPSPDVNAPSPSPDLDLELPEESPTTKELNNSTMNYSASISFTNLGYYNPAPPPPPPANNPNTIANSTTGNVHENNLNFGSNGFSSFLGQELPFEFSGLSSGGLFTNSSSENNPINHSDSNGIKYGNNLSAENTAAAEMTAYNPLLPPPMPPFSKNNDDSGFNFKSNMDTVANNFVYSNENAGGQQTCASNYTYLASDQNQYGESKKYDPANIPPMWNEPENPAWNNNMNTLETPESPPIFEKEGYNNAVEYHENIPTSAIDVDQRILPGLGDLDNSLHTSDNKDVDHRNLISLTGSPGIDKVRCTSLPERGHLKTITPHDSWSHSDQDYRTFPLSNKPADRLDVQPPPPPPPVQQDQDYRLQFNFENIPPPPPLPGNSTTSSTLHLPPLPPPLPPMHMSKSPKKTKDNVENVDMDLSDDLENSIANEGIKHFSLEPPPPLPNILNDVDANQFLDDISNDLSDFNNMTDQNKTPKINIIENVSRWPKPEVSRNHVGTLPPPPTPSLMDFGINSNNLIRMDINNQSSAIGSMPTQNTSNWTTDHSWSPSNNYVEDNSYMSEENNMYNNNFRRGKGMSNYRGDFRGGFRGRGRNRNLGSGGSHWNRGNNRSGRGSFRGRGKFIGGMNRGSF